MHASTVILVAFLTSVLTTTGTVFVIERLGVFQTEQQASVPNVRGLSEGDARANLEAAGLVPIIGPREVSAEAKPGTVLRQSVPAGQNLPRGHQVTLTLAEAPPKVPNLAGLTLAEARVALEREGYKLETDDPVPNAEVPAGKVVKQVPSADTPHEKGRTVVVQVSSGPAEVEVPKLSGLALNKAKEELEKLGLKAAVVWVSRAETATYAVLGQKPLAGEKLAPGSEVELTVNR
ncbi:MAG: PASTA domain-containing protein [Pseudomonadota bacterium]|nr:MAG: hypothetical protein DIU78_03990 [Pseudomonadota bacterium]